MVHKGSKCICFEKWGVQQTALYHWFSLSGRFGDAAVIPDVAAAAYARRCVVRSKVAMTPECVYIRLHQRYSHNMGL